MCFKKVNAVVFAGGFPKKSQILKLKSAKIKTLCFATSNTIAQKMISNGVDGLILKEMRLEDILDLFP